MRRFAYLLFPLFVGLFLVAIAVVATAVLAQSQPQTREDQGIAPPPQMAIQAVQSQTIDLELVETEAVPQHQFLAAGSAADTCSDASLLFDGVTVDGGVTTMNNMTVAADDPNLQSCLWGSPSSLQGYRTVWYKFTAPRNGLVNVDTFETSFDTILAVYQNISDDNDPCDSFSENLIQLTCSDDQRGLTSEVTFAVRRDQTYYVQIADWQPGVSGNSILRLVATIEPIDSFWDVVSTPDNLPGPIARHAVVADGSRFIYVIGGQTTLGSTPIVTKRMTRFDTETGQWEEMASIPGAAGLSNTTAAYVDGKIYVPGGYNGNNELFDGTHWVYDVATNSWSNGAPTIGDSAGGWPVGDVPFAWATAVSPPSNDRYHLLGGLVSSTNTTPTERILNTFYTYSTFTSQWVREPDMVNPRYAHTAGILNNGDVCVVGGLTGSPNNLALLSTGECYDGFRWNPIAPLNVPRYNAGSVVRPHGNWYVFGGLDGAGNEVSITEMYDRETNSWIELDINYDLGAAPELPARSWPRGAFVEPDLWVFGGDYLDTQAGQNKALDLVERLRLLFQPNKQNLPYVSRQPSNDSFRGATRIFLNQAQHHSFGGEEDFYDTYVFDITSPRNILVRLEVPDGRDYDLFVYDSNKTLWGESKVPFLGDNEAVTLNNLAPGRYYVVAFRDHPGDGPDNAGYQVSVRDR
ncbi:MAG: kelch repeat-containing protein [Chloroflexota bacterium]